MSSMYAIPPVVPEDLEVKPMEIMYHIPNYHATPSQKEAEPECNGFPEDHHDPVKTIEKKQHALIHSLKELGSTLDNLLTEMGKSAKASASPSPCKKSKQDESAPSSSEPSSAKNGSKKDKEAKKEARKAAKTEAKSKVSAGTATPAGKPSSTAPQWTIHEEKRTTETGQSLTACLPPVFTDFGREKLGDVTLTATQTDRPWVEALSHLGEKRNVAFKGEVSNACSDSSTTVTVSFGDKFSAVSSACELTCRVSAWKLLGSALGLFSFASNHSIQSAHQHRWLSKVDMALAGKLSNDMVIREASKFLSHYDALGSQFDFGVADVVAKSVLVASSSPVLPNNVELWSKRLDTVM